ncbi:hypothetical protein CPB86DRAFT_773518 [Serendipita vermifera]|nr:hypothetical protein CPB86DRAFT_773518 [Serendipita vermifera]
MATLLMDRLTLDSSTPPSFQRQDLITTEGSSFLEESTPNSTKKKKKKKPKKAKSTNALSPNTTEPTPDIKQPILCISRNKHWRYISSYHGPWLQLPLELLESLLMLNLDPSNFTPKDERGYPSDLDGKLGSSSVPNALTIRPPTVKPIPPPIDPGVFRSVTTIRRLIDEASDLAVRAASGLSASALGALRSPTIGGGPWAAAQALGINPMNDQNNGRSSSMSSTRTHRLRVLAVQKLAEAYKADEIAASVMVMQGASALEDIAERVLRIDPNDLNARYVHFFHEKIPSRQLAESTTTELLDELIEAQPTRLHYFRTRGIVRCFRDEYSLAIKDFTHVLRESRALRKAKGSHHSDENYHPKLKGKKKSEAKTNGRAPPNGTSVPDVPPDKAASQEQSTAKAPGLHPSVGPDAPDPIEPQVLFLRAAAYLQHAVHLIEEAMLQVEGVDRIPAQDALELRMLLMNKGKYGGVTAEGPHGPLGPKNGTRMRVYRQAMTAPQLKGTVTGLLKKSVRDHEKFMNYFDTVDGKLPTFPGNLAQRVEAAFLLSESLRPGSQSPPPPVPENPGIFTTYHPLLVESHFSVLLCYMLLGDFISVLPAYQRAAALIDGLEGYPVFLPARSMAQAEFVEILERLTTSWAPGTQLLASSRPKLLMIEDTPSTDSPVGTDTPFDITRESSASTRTASPITEEDGLSLSSDLTRGSLALTLSFNNQYQPMAPSPREDTGSPDVEFDLDGITDPVERNSINLNCLRVLLSPVAKRQRTRMEQERDGGQDGDGANGNKAAGLSINIPLHGPRVDISLAYIAAVHLPELDP